MKNLKLIWLVLLTFFCVGNIFAQTNSNQCENYGKKDFKGKPINLNVVDTDLKNILNKITDEFGCNFVVDKSVNAGQITLKVEDVPWNILLDAILRSQDLAWMMKSGTEIKTNKKSDLIFISTKENILNEIEWWKNCFPNEKGISLEPLFTEFIKIKKPSEAKSDYFNNSQKYFSRYLTRRGSIEIDERSNSLVVTDVRENLDAIKTLIHILDNEEKENYQYRFHGGDSTPLYTEFIKLNYLSACDNIYSCTFEKTYTPSHSSKVVKLISKFISRRGSVETDSRSNSLVITDTKERVDLILKRLRELDKPDTNLDEIIKNF